MDTKFKNKKLLIQVLDRCIEFKYYTSVIANIRYMITNNNITFEQALNVCMLSRLRSRVYRKISQMYHMDIRILNVNKFYKKQKGINKNE